MIKNSINQFRFLFSHHFYDLWADPLRNSSGGITNSEESSRQILLKKMSCFFRERQNLQRVKGLSVSFYSEFETKIRRFQRSMNLSWKEYLLIIYLQRTNHANYIYSYLNVFLFKDPEFCNKISFSIVKLYRPLLITIFV